MTLAAALPAVTRAMSVQFDVNPKIIRIGERATANFTVEGIQNPSLPQLPPIDGIQMGQPHTSTSMSIVNGRGSTTYTVSYALVPLRAGDFTFGPYKYQSNGQVLDLPAVELKVLPPRGASENGQQGADNAPTIFAKIETGRDAYFNQEVFDILFEVYYQRGLNVRSGLEIMNLPESGLILEGPVELQANPVQIGNNIYDVHRYRCKTHALTAGTFPLDLVLHVPVEIQREQQRRRGFFDFPDMFGGRELQKVSVVPEPIDLVIKPLPTTNVPPGFSGAVGIFTFDIEVKPRELQAGEPITIAMNISGSGNIENVVAPTFEAGDLFKTYDTRLLNDRIDRQQARGTKIFEQVVIPRSDAVKELPPMTFSYFNPVRAVYETIRRGPVPLVVHPSSSSPAQLLQAHVNGTKDQAQILGMDISYLQPEPREWRRLSDRPWYVEPGVLAAQALPVLGLLALFLTRQRKEGLKRDVAKARRLRAPRSAAAGLRKATEALRQNDAPGCVDGLWDALASYYGDRLNLSPGEISPTLVLQALEKGGMDEGQRRELSTIFSLCDEVRFSGATSTDAATLQNMLKNIPALLKASEKIRL